MIYFVQTDIFEIEAENVGGLQKIGIGHDRKDKGRNLTKKLRLRVLIADSNLRCFWFSKCCSKKH